MCEVVGAWPDLPAALRAGVLAIVRSHLGDLFTNRGSESASGAKVGAARAAKRNSSGAGAKPDLPVCEQVGRGTREDSTRRGSVAPSCPCEARDGVCVGHRRGCPFGDDCGAVIVGGRKAGRK